MSKSNRPEQIMALLEEHRAMTVEQLAQAVYTSPSSIRRDLRRLAEQNRIKRTHGGARLPDDAPAPLNSRVPGEVLDFAIVCPLSRGKRGRKSVAKKRS